MATDKSEPRVGLILRVGALSIVTLIATHTALVAYFDQVAQGEEQRKVSSAKPEALMSVRADEKQRLTTGPMPIDKAKEMLLHGVRSPDIAPSSSPDVAPIQGWVKMPNEVPTPMMMAASAAASGAVPAPSAAPAPDAGVSPGADAGARDAAPPKRPH
jgi:hypothetical protein